MFVKDGVFLAKSELMGVKPYHIKDAQKKAGKTGATSVGEKTTQIHGGGDEDEEDTTELESQADDFLRVENEF